ncbi:MAG TPA: PmoA family protein [Verrucomicrobiae bacterium]|nr:PmoA family protein [Verrucomicrobiae bacterium]
MKRNRTYRLLALWFCFVAGIASRSYAADGVQITPVDDKLRIEINGQLFSEYHYKDVARQFLYPLLGPDQLAMSRKWPVEESTDEQHDHPHHRGLWYAHSSVNGFDFWSEGKGCKIEHQKFLDVSSGADSGVIVETNNWIGSDGTFVCSEKRSIRIYNRPGTERLLDFDITFYAPPDKSVVFGDEKDGAMATRIAETMRLTHEDGKKTVPGEGHIVMSTGVRDGATWGKRADWCDYYGPVGGKTVGIAIFDHPDNLRHPTWWHVRDYGLFSANPFGVHDFEKKPKHTGDYTLEAGKTLTFRYRFYYHEGDEVQAKVAEHYSDYVAGKN